MVNGEGVSRAMKVDAGFEASARWMPSIFDSLTIFIQRIPTVPFNWHVRSGDESSNRSETCHTDVCRITLSVIRISVNRREWYYQCCKMERYIPKPDLKCI